MEHQPRMACQAMRMHKTEQKNGLGLLCQIDQPSLE